jgi:hypothetical protein
MGIRMDVRPRASHADKTMSAKPTALEGQVNWRVERPGAGLERSERRLAEEPSCRRQRPALEGQNK